MKCPNCNKQAVFTETMDHNGNYYLECPNCGIHFVNTTQLRADMDESYQREYFAVMAMQGLLSNPIVCEKSEADVRPVIPERIAMLAVAHADALIAELKKK